MTVLIILGLVCSIAMLMAGVGANFKGQRIRSGLYLVLSVGVSLVPFFIVLESLKP